MVRSRLAAGIAAALLMMALAWAAWLLVGGWAVREGLSSARQRMAEGRYEAARDRLAALALSWPRDDEVSYLRGDCEAKLDRPEAALAAWGLVPAGSALAGPTRLAEGRLLVHSLGRLGDAERAFRAAILGGGTAAMPARWALAELLLWEGRLVEMRRLLREIWRVGSPSDRIVALREHWRLDSVIVAEEEVRPVLERGWRNAPADPHAWLARAYLATQYGRYDEARDWLDRCDAQRMVDPSLDEIVSRARLRWAMAAGKVDEARRELAAIPVDRFDPKEVWSIRAWFAAQVKDAEAEREALEHLVAIEPGDTRALDRLAELAVRAGQADRAASIRRRQEDALRDKERYRRLLIANRDPIPLDDLRERARLADRLGRRFEAEGWLTLVLQRDPGDRETRATLDRLLARKEPSPGDTPVEPVTHHEAGSIAASTEPSTVAIVFRDDAERARLRFTYENGETPQHQIPETIGGGVAVLDFDGDGWLDVYVVQGGAFPPDRVSSRAASVSERVTPLPEPLPLPDGRGSVQQEAGATTGDRLFRNRRDGTFEDATVASGIAQFARGYGFGATAGDYDNDGRPDLFVTRFGSYALYRNRGDGTFEDVTERAGLGGTRDWPTSAAFADLDGDGDLDLYVCHYLKWDARNPTICHDPRAGDRTVSCLPLGFPAEPDHLFRNDGGRFVDVTAEAGIVDRDGRGLGVVAADLDDDGRIDLFVANDMTANLFFHNRGGLKFEEIGHAAGVASNADGGYQAGMGVACGDLDGDGRPDLAVTNFFGESTTFYRNLGAAMFADATAAVGLKAPSRFLLGFGAVFLDVDNDGRLDLATANGHIHDLRPNVPYPMPAQLLVGGTDGRLTDVSGRAGEPWTVPRIGRGLAAADLDNDGRLDLLLVAQNSPLAFFHNQTERAGHFLTLRLEGATSNRDAVGAKVTITAGGRRQTAWRIGGGSYLSASDPRLHFGLGSAQVIDDLEIRWPSGSVQKFGKLAADRAYHVREGDARPRASEPIEKTGTTNQTNYHEWDWADGRLRRTTKNTNGHEKNRTGG
jgi:enediyne biosynthesis protein E4